MILLLLENDFAFDRERIALRLELDLRVPWMQGR